jgi:hypothetical protein
VKVLLLLKLPLSRKAISSGISALDFRKISVEPWRGKHANSASWPLEESDHWSQDDEVFDYIWSEIWCFGVYQDFVLFVPSKYEDTCTSWGGRKNGESLRTLGVTVVDMLTRYTHHGLYSGKPAWPTDDGRAYGSTGRRNCWRHKMDESIRSDPKRDRRRSDPWRARQARLAQFRPSRIWLNLYHVTLDRTFFISRILGARGIENTTHCNLAFVTW